MLLAAVFGPSLILTMIGLGGGLILSPLFILLDMPQNQAVAASLLLNGLAASSIFIVFFSSTSAFITPASLTRLEWSFLAPAAACALLAGQIGSRLMSERLKGETGRVMFGAVLFLLSLKLFVRALP